MDESVSNNVSSPSAAPSNGWSVRHLLLFGVLYFLAAHFGALMMKGREAFVSLWLPSGLYLGAALLVPAEKRRYVFAAGLLANILFDLSDRKPLLLVSTLGIINTLSVLTSLFLYNLIRQRVFLRGLSESHHDKTHDSSSNNPESLYLLTPRFLLSLMFAAGMSAAVWGAIGSAVITLSAREMAFIEIWLRWAGGDLMGVIVVTPLLFSVVGLWRECRDPLLCPCRPEFGLVCLVLVAVAVAISHSRFLLFHQKYLLWPIMILIAYRFETAGTSMANLLLLVSLMLSGGLEPGGAFCPEHGGQLVLLFLSCRCS